MQEELSKIYSQMKFVLKKQKFVNNSENMEGLLTFANLEVEKTN